MYKKVWIIGIPHESFGLFMKSKSQVKHVILTTKCGLRSSQGSQISWVIEIEPLLELGVINF